MCQPSCAMRKRRPYLAAFLWTHCFAAGEENVRSAAIPWLWLEWPGGATHFRAACGLPYFLKAAFHSSVWRSGERYPDMMFTPDGASCSIAARRSPKAPRKCEMWSCDLPCCKCVFSTPRELPPVRAVGEKGLADPRQRVSRKRASSECRPASAGCNWSRSDCVGTAPDRARWFPA